MKDTTIPGVSFHSFGEGKMGPLIRAHDWSKTSLGPMKDWPNSLKTHVNMMLALPSAAIIFWGEDQVQIYNDAYSVIMGPRHPRHLGSTFQECWPEAYPIIDHWMKRVTINGEVVIVDRSLIPLTRHGFNEECYFTFTFSPLRNEEGKIEGLLQLVTEVTDTILSERRLDMLRKLSPSTDLESCSTTNLLDVLASNPRDIRFAQFFLHNGAPSPLQLAEGFGIGNQINKAPGYSEFMMLARDTYASGVPREIKNIQNLIPHAPIEPWDEPTTQAIVLPIRSNDLASSKGVVVFGISPRLKFDKNYYSFLLDAARELAIGMEADEQINRSMKTRKAYDFVNAIIENVPHMIFIKDAKELKFTRINRAGEELLGLTRDELCGKSDYDFFSKEEADFFTEKDRTTLASHKILDIPEEKIQTRLKGTRILHTKKVTLYDENGQPEFLMGISEDITEKKQFEEDHKKLSQEKIARAEAEKALILRDEFISIAAHELNTPLTALKMQIYLIRNFMVEMESERTQKFLEMMRNSEEKLNQFAKLVENLLEVSRARAGKLIIEKTEIDLCEIIHRVCKNCEHELLKAKCRLELHLETSVKGYWDPVRIEQVLTNLLSNAMKYGSGKSIEIVCKREINRAIIMVKDHGIGIAKEDQDRIFNRFERAVSMRAFGGFGLGLYITKQIVNAHGGEIRVESELGRGSTFIVELPLKS